MLAIHSAQVADLPQVQCLTVDSPVGVMSSSDDAECLRGKILAFEASFTVEMSYNGEESYFSVSEDSASGELVGCSAIVASAGFSEPLYSFRNETSMHASRSLSIHNEIHVLSLCHNFIGNSPLTSLYVQRDLVQSVYAEFNSRGRLLFTANHPERFTDAVVVEIVSYSDEQSKSSLWSAVGRNFFDLNHIEAEKLSGLKSRISLVELMPHYPIYVLLLLDATQESMGQVHSRAQITFDTLMRESFETDSYIGISDGGSTLHARTSGIRSIAQSRVVPVKTGEVPKSGRPYLVTNDQLQDFRAVVLDLDWTSGKPVALSVEIAEALSVGKGASVRLVAV